MPCGCPTAGCEAQQDPERRAEADRDLTAHMTGAILRLFRGCPTGEANRSSQLWCGRSASGVYIRGAGTGTGGPDGSCYCGHLPETNYSDPVGSAPLNLE